jgi:8-oxo-dGTP pyrophosphatase MutT (NUDIX family)
MNRELAEETGYVCRKVRPVAKLKIVPSRINNTVHVFFGDDAKLVHTQLEDDKGIKPVLVTEQQFNRLVTTGKFDDIAGIAVYYLVKLKKFI